MNLAMRSCSACQLQPRLLLSLSAHLGIFGRHIFVGRRGTRSWWFGMKGSGSGGGTCALFSIKRALSFSRPALYPSLCSPSPRKIRTNNVAGTPDVGDYAPASDARQRATGYFVRPSRSPAYDPTDRAPSIHASTHHTTRHVFPLSWLTSPLNFLSSTHHHYYPPLPPPHDRTSEHLGARQRK